MIPELRELLEVSRRRVLMVYQHSARGQVFREWLDAITDRVLGEIPDAHTAVYEGGQVAMFFISLDERRIQAIGRRLGRYLRGKAEGRVRDC